MNRRRNTRRRKEIIPGIDNKVFYGIIIVSLAIITIFILMLHYKKVDDSTKVAEEMRKNNNEVTQTLNETNNEIGSTDNYETNKIIRVSFIGDINSGSKIENDNTNYDSIFTDAKEQLKDADIALGTYSSDVKTDNQKSLAKSVYNSGVDLLSIATNETNNDQESVEEKRKSLNEIGFETVGQEEEKQEDRVNIIEKRGVKIAIIGYTAETNSKASKTGINLYDTEKAQNDIKYAKENASFVIVMVNWKNSQSTEASSKERDIAKELISNGANIIIGTNSNCLQKFELVETKNTEGQSEDVQNEEEQNKDEQIENIQDVNLTNQNTQGENESKQAFIAYSIGNYFSETNIEKSKIELILNLQIYVDTNGNADIYKIDYTPMYMYDNKQPLNEQNRFKILNVKQEISNYDEGKENISSKTYKELTNGLDSIKKILGIEN